MHDVESIVYLLLLLIGYGYPSVTREETADSSFSGITHISEKFQFLRDSYFRNDFHIVFAVYTGQAESSHRVLDHTKQQQ